MNLFFIFRSCLILFLSGCCNVSVFSQVTIGFQGGEPGDSWGYTSTGASALAQNEAMLTPNKITGTTSLVAGGDTGGGNCFASGSGNGPNVARTFTFAPLDISSSNNEVRTLTFNWGNRYPVCNGTGWDSGENLVFQAYHDGIAQAPVTLAVGYNNASFSIHANQYSWSVPPCVNQFYFVVSVTTNRADELLFIDDVQLTAPQLNQPVDQPSVIAGDTVVCAGNTATYSVIQENGIGYTWSGLPPGAVFDTPNGTNTITVNWGTAAPGTYILVVTPSSVCGSVGPERELEVTINVAPDPVVITGPSTVCPGDVIMLTSSSTSGNEWSTGETTPSITVSGEGIYTVTVQTSCGTETDTHTVTLIPEPQANITVIGSTSLCPGEEVTLMSDSPAGNLWSTGETTPSIVVSTAGIYTVTVSNECGQVVSDPVTVVMNQPPVALLTGDTLICHGEVTALTVSGGTSRLWSTGSTEASILVDDAGVYSVMVFNECGVDTVFVQVHFSVVTADFNASPPEGPAPLTVNFTNNSSSNSISYDWDMGDGSGSIAVHPDHVFGVPGIYTVVLTVANEQGCTDAFAQDIIVQSPLSSLTVPNVFTPNGDYVNDYFLVESENLERFEMQILNRWGNHIITILDASEGWDGNSEGKASAEGTYFYRIEAVGIDQQTYNLSGFFQLVR